MNEIHPFCKAQITLLKFIGAPITVFLEYSNFADVYLMELVAELPEHTGINNHVIDFVDGKKSLYEPIYNLWPIALKTSKTYIKINLADGFI